MGFSIRLAPGVRVRASSRGVRTSIGPRAARVHVGAGQTGFSTGAGPVGFYTSLGGGRPKARRPAAASGQRPPAASARQLAAADKEREARRLAAAFTELVSIHQQEFTPATRPIAAMPPLPDEAEVLRRHEKAALAGVGMFRRTEGNAARLQAAAAAQAELAAARSAAEEQRIAAQQELDRLWAALTGNEPDVVLAALAEAFEDNKAAAAPLGADGDEVSLVVLAPAESVVPERMPGTTQAGNLTLRKLPKGERAALYTAAVAGHLLVTMREAFAVAPGLAAARAVVLRRGAVDAYGKTQLECVVAGRWTRASFNGVHWQQADALTVTRDTASELLVNLRAGKELRPLDLHGEPGINELLTRTDSEELLDHKGE